MDLQSGHIIDKLRQGDPAAFNVFVTRYRDEVFRICYRILLNADDADDIAQEVFIEVMRSVGQFRGDSSITTWLYRIATNKALNLLKRRSRFSIWSALEEKASQHPDSALASDFIEFSETELALRAALDQLSPDQRVALTLHRYEDLSYQEIAETMQITVNAVGVLINRARNNLKKYLTEYFDQ